MNKERVFILLYISLDVSVTVLHIPPFVIYLAGCVCYSVTYSTICYISRWLCLLQCYIFHLYVGVRAGGGIGDEIDSPDGDPYEVYRILFDITFFFFVIIILLAIIQGKWTLPYST